MASAVIASFALVLVPGGALAFAADPALPALRMYVAAVAKADCDMAWRLTSSAVKQRDRQGTARSAYCGVLENLRKAGVTESVGAPIAHMEDGLRHAVFVPTARASNAPGFLPVSRSMYVVHSSDGGRSWEVLDLGCVDQRWVRDVYPA
jgi:hypothetical protein